MEGGGRAARAGGPRARRLVPVGVSRGRGSAGTSTATAPDPARSPSRDGRDLAGFRPLADALAGAAAHDDFTYSREEHRMKPGIKPTIVLLGVLGIGDLAAVPLMVAANHHNPAKPPIPAIVAVAIIGLLTLASAAGLAQGPRWSFPVAVASQVLDSVSALLGLQAHPNAAVVCVAAGTPRLSSAAGRAFGRAHAGEEQQ